MVFNLPWGIKDYAGSLFTIQTVVREQDLQLVTTYSDLLMLIFVATGLTVVIIRSVYLHESHINPMIVSRLANFNLLSLIKSSYEIYHKATIWTIFNILATVLILINVIAGRSAVWVGIIGVTATIILVVILLQDVYKEIENVRREPSKYKWD